MKLLILVESIPKIKKNETVLKAFGVLLKDYFIKQRVAYNIYESEKEQKKFKVRFFMTIFILLKNFHSIDEKHEK